MCSLIKLLSVGGFQRVVRVSGAEIKMVISRTSFKRRTSKKALETYFGIIEHKIKF